MISAYRGVYQTFTADSCLNEAEVIVFYHCLFLTYTSFMTIFQLQALQPLSRLSRDFSDFSRDIGQRNRTFRQTLCGRSATENSNNSDVGNISTNAPQSIGLGLLASACGLSNDTFGGFDLKQLPSAMSRLWPTVFGNATNSSSSQPKSCRDLNYNTVNRKGT